MTKTASKRPFDFGRVFFPGENAKAEKVPSIIRFQPLNNHVSNVSQLVRYWDKERLPQRGQSIERIVRASDIHDIGKPQKFEMRSDTNAEGKFKQYIYSFRGHRFLATSEDKWAEKMAIGHHDFSAKEICKDTYRLKQEPLYQEILSSDPLAYAKELYVLEMCDQIEAELACRTMEDEEQGSSRTFMDFTIQRDTEAPQSYQTYRIDPWPFSKEHDEIELTFTYWEFRLQKSEQEKLSSLEEKAQYRLGAVLDSIVKSWWGNSDLTEKDAAQIKIKVLPYVSSDREQTESQSAEDFYKRAANYQPNPMQAEMFELLYDVDKLDPPAIILKAPTGGGKTEAVLFPALAARRRLFLPLPARSLLEDQKVRIEEYMKTFSLLHPQQEFSLVVDTGSQMKRYIYQAGKEVFRDINSRRHLYKGDVVLTTIDKMLYRFFAYGDQKKSFTFPIRLNRDRSLICFDEAHSYDELSFTNFHSLVTALYEAGQSLVVMTATLPKTHQQYFDDFQVIDYVENGEKADALRAFQDKTLHRPYADKRDFIWRQDIGRDSEAPESFQTSIAGLAVQVSDSRSAPRILVVVQRVMDAVAIYQKIKRSLSDQTQQPKLYLYHGRIADQVRPDLYKRINLSDHQSEPYILVTTSAVEVGCDLSAEVLITEICPPENLIQRAGRCNRRGNVADAEVIVVGDEIPAFANSLDDGGLKQYKNHLLAMSGNQFNAQATGACIARTPHVDDYRVVEIFSMLYEYIYGADLTCQPAHERGLVPTRSWTPSVELRVYLSEENYHSISVPVDRLAAKEGISYAYTGLFEHYYDVETTRYKDEPVKRWGDIYKKQLIVKICPGLDDFVFDDACPYNYIEEIGFADLPKIFESTWTQGADVKLKYGYEDASGKKNTVIYSYVNSLQ